MSFQVVDGANRRVVATLPTFAAAETHARRACKEHGGAMEICRERDGKLVATVRKDAYGKVWTDITTMHGAPA